MINQFKNKNEFLSNFYKSNIEFGGKRYPTIEHAYQAAKTLDLVKREEIRLATTPAKAKKLGRKVPMRPLWDNLKFTIMYTFVYEKFNIYSDLKQKLLNTEEQELIEGNDWGDKYWGICCEEGENNLGKILMEVRRRLQEMEPLRLNKGVKS